ncbi:hypothetical protein PSI19_14045 [Xenorhabdus khoisanae]|uniref:hypothetical protein n=1 Tax=Xenorhabdus khoisanae TaxID=880157 RepID=UPI002359FC84|nr:hypothetical protein [Xenorhabdus khoisanae]MDC9614962.1 hypothetical protein [Xenorhabdus khoisanae]
MVTEKGDIAYYQQPNFSIELSLIDTTDAKKGTYLMILDAEGIRNARVSSVKVGGKIEYVNIPSTASSNKVVCAIYIKDTDNSSYPLVGTIYLDYHPLSEVVDIATVKVSSESQLSLNVDRVDRTRFDFKLKAK